MASDVQVGVQSDGRRRRPTTDAALLKQIRDHDEVFRDLRPTPHRLISVVFNSEIADDGDLTRHVKIVIELGEITENSRYRWRIPHITGRSPFAIDVGTRPYPLAYEIQKVTGEHGVGHTEIVVDLSKCEPHEIHELRITYSQDGFVDVVRRGIFFAQRTYVWSYTFVTETRYFETRATFPRGAHVAFLDGDSTLYTEISIADVDGRKVYCYSHLKPRPGERVYGRITYRIWSHSMGPTVALVGSALVALPAAFAAGPLIGLVTAMLSAAVTAVSYLIVQRFD